MVVNITGGTTAMQHIVQQVAAFAAELGRPVRRAALVDRRLPQEQREEQYVPGELIRLDRERGSESIVNVEKITFRYRVLTPLLVYFLEF